MKLKKQLSFQEDQVYRGKRRNQSQQIPNFKPRIERDSSTKRRTDENDDQVEIEDPVESTRASVPRSTLDQVD